MFRWSESARFWIVLGCINITIPVVTIWKMHAGDLNRATALLTCWICFPLFNAVFLFTTRSWSHRSEPLGTSGKIVLVVALALMAALGTTVYLNSYALKNRYYASAMSDAPLASIRPARRRIVVEMIRKRAASSKEYQAKAAHFRPITPPLYSPESFGGTETMNSTVGQLQHAFDIDASYFDDLKQSDAEFREEMEQADPQYLQSWLSSPNNEEEAADSVFAMERHWVQSVHDLYQYAASHHQSIIVRGGSLTFSSSQVSAKFQDLERASVGLQQKMQSARAALVKKQQESAAKVSD
jgi:hypothetical protein